MLQDNLETEFNQFQGCNMSRRLKKLCLAQFVLLSLVACGGGEDEGNNAENFIPPSNIAVNGKIQHSADTGKYFSYGEDHFGGYGHNAYHCAENYNDYYYETDNFMIFGNPALPLSDFESAAKWVESNLSSALTSFGISKSGYFDARGRARISVLNHIRFGLESQYYSNVEYPAEFDNMSFESQVMWATTKAKQLSDEEILTLVREYPYDENKLESEIFLEEKIYVCLHENQGAYGWGEGTPMGITIGAESVSTLPYNVDKVVQHELIHTFQHALSSSYEGSKLPRWFAEGQAVYLSGMNIAEKQNYGDYHPTSVIDFTDEYGDVSQAYEHYGLAYKYLAEANSKSVINDMLKHVGELNHSWMVQGDADYKENHNYVEAFEQHIKQQDGTPLSVHQFREDYHQIMSAYAN